MHVLRLPAGTSEYLQSRVRVDKDATDPTTYTVAMALIDADAAPVSGDWAGASWATGGPPYYAQKLYAPAAGLYRLWVRVTTPNETVVRPAGLVEFYAAAP